MILYILIICAALLLSIFFSGLETAFTSLNRLQQHIIITKYPRRGKILKKFLDNPMLVLSTILIGNTTANTCFSIALSQIVVLTFGSQMLALIAGLITLFLLIFCEISPKQLSLRFNDAIMVRALIPLYCFQILLFPFSLVLNGITKLLHMFIAQQSKGQNTEILTRKHLATLFYTAQSYGELESENAYAITRILSFSTLPIESVMIHRKSVISFSSQNRIKDIELVLREHVYSSYPVYEKGNQEHIIGIVRLHDIISEKNKEKTIKQFTQKPLFIHENKPVYEVINMLKIRENSLGIILDEFGGFSGIVSTRDIMRYIFDFENSHLDEAKISEIYMELDAHRILLGGAAPLTEIEEHSGTIIEPSPVSNTIGGYILELTQNIPTTGSTVETSLGTFKILRAKQNRISSLLWLLPQKTS